MIMKKIWQAWKQGWIVILKCAHFMIYVQVVAIPGYVGYYLLNPEKTAVVDNAGFHVKPLLGVLVLVLWAPFAFFVGSWMTGYFRKEKDLQNNERVCTSP